MYSQNRLSFMRVAFGFGKSLTDVVPVSLILLPVCVKRKSDLLTDVICVFFLSYSPLRLSLVSVVFDFNDSLNDVAPASPM